MLLERIRNFFKKTIITKLENEFDNCTFEMEFIKEEEKYLKITCTAHTPLSERDLRHITKATDGTIYNIEELEDCTIYTLKSYL